MSGSCAPIYVCICLRDGEIGTRSFIQLVVRIGDAPAEWGVVKFAEMLRLACRVPVMRGQFSRRSAPVTAAGRQASPRLVT
jgi:hypothetical protein